MGRSRARCLYAQGEIGDRKAVALGLFILASNFWISFRSRSDGMLFNAWYLGKMRAGIHCYNFMIAPTRTGKPQDSIIVPFARWIATPNVTSADRERGAHCARRSDTHYRMSVVMGEDLDRDGRARPKMNLVPTPSRLPLSRARTPAWVLVAGDFHREGGMDRANAEFATYLCAAGVTVHLVSYRVDGELASHPQVHVHLAKRVSRVHFLARRQLDQLGCKVAADVIKALRKRLASAG